MDGHAGHERGLCGTRARADERVEADAPGGLGRDQRPVYRAQTAVERELPEHEHAARALARQLIAGGQDGHRHGEVVARPELRHVAGREVDDDASLRPPELAREHCRAYPLARLVDRPVGQAHDDRRAMLAPAHARFDLDQLAVDPDRRLTVGRGDHDGEAMAALRHETCSRWNASARVRTRWSCPRLRVCHSARAGHPPMDAPSAGAG